MFVRESWQKLIPDLWRDQEVGFKKLAPSLQDLDFPGMMADDERTKHEFPEVPVVR